MSIVGWKLMYLVLSAFFGVLGVYSFFAGSFGNYAPAACLILTFIFFGIALVLEVLDAIDYKIDIIFRSAVEMIKAGQVPKRED